MADDEITLFNTCTDLVGLRRMEAFPVGLLQAKRPGEWIRVREFCLEIGVIAGDLSIVFAETTVTTQHLADGIAADYDATGRLAGLEILDVRSRLGGADTFRRVILEGVGGVIPGQTVPHP